MNVKKPNSADKLKAAQPDPTRRFADRVADYVKSRPRYPEPVLAYLQQTTDFSPADQVADVGSGTGILAELFLKNGNRVYGVEPNAEMRSAAEAALAGYANFFSVAGKAEASGLATKSVDLVTAGQAFHWFDAEKARVEFRRILKSYGHVALIWNVRQLEGSPFMRAYEAMLRTYAPTYAQVNHRDNVGGALLEAFFAPHGYQVANFSHTQHFNFEGLRSRLLSSSYSPQPGQPGHAGLMVRLAEIYAQFKSEEKVSFLYETQIFLGRPGE
jgi:SAM-dependent methyltransferase